MVAVAMQELMHDPEHGPELKGRIHALANKALDIADYAMSNADMATRVRVAQQFLPAMVKEAAASDDSDRLRELEAQISEMRQTFAGNFGVARAPEATEDTPPAPPAPPAPAVS
jgi:hypothetical protein